MKALKISGRILLGAVAVLVLFYLVLLAVNWKDQPPSAAAVRFDQIIAARPQPPAAENAVRTVDAIALLGPSGLLRIDLAGEIYTLRLTRNHRLILTK